jgi:two-component system chemotaxis response regulator CheB
MRSVACSLSRPPTTVLAVAASAGGFEPLKDLMMQLPTDLALSVLIVVHIPPDHPTLLAKLLDRVSAYEVLQAADGMPVESERAYVAPPDHHMTLFQRYIRVTSGPRENRVRPAADPLFRSTARWYGDQAVGLVLSGMRSDGAKGLAELHQRGGRALVQDPGQADFPPMPEAAIKADHPDLIGTPGMFVEVIVQTAEANQKREAAHHDNVWGAGTSEYGAEAAAGQSKDEV